MSLESIQADLRTLEGELLRKRANIQDRFDCGELDAAGVDREMKTLVACYRTREDQIRARLSEEFTERSL